METIKVNVWQMGYTNKKDFKEDNRANAVCRGRGYVLLPNRSVYKSIDDILEDSPYWEEEVWDTLNWGSHTNKKPDNVHSTLNHCNSDIILHVDGTKEWRWAKCIGFGRAKTLQEAIRLMKTESTCGFWMFSEDTQN